MLCAAESDPLRVVSIAEGTWLSGPLKPLLAFAQSLRSERVRGRRVEVSILTTARCRDPRHVPENQLIRAVRAAGVDIGVAVERHAWDVGLIPQLRTLIEARTPAIVETHQVKSHFLLLQALMWGGLHRNFKWIAFHHGYTNASIKLSLYEQLDRVSLRFADRVVAVCEPFAQEARRRGVTPEHVITVPNFTVPFPDSARANVPALRRELGLGPAENTIVSVGRLSREKGHAHLIRAIAQEPALLSREGLKVVIVGDGPERRPLERLAARLRLLDRVVFTGQQQHVWPYYLLGEVFVLPSLKEGSPLVLFEAAAAGRAVVASAVGGVPEVVVNGESAILVPPADPRSLGAGIARMLKDSDLRAACVRQIRIRGAEFTQARHTGRLLSLYESLVT